MEERGIERYPSPPMDASSRRRQSLVTACPRRGARPITPVFPTVFRRRGECCHERDRGDKTATGPARPPRRRPSWQCEEATIGASADFSSTSASSSGPMAGHSNATAGRQAHAKVGRLHSGRSEAAAGGASQCPLPRPQRLRGSRRCVEEGDKQGCITGATLIWQRRLTSPYSARLALHSGPANRYKEQRQPRADQRPDDCCHRRKAAGGGEEPLQATVPAKKK